MQNQFKYRAYAWRQFKQNKPALVALYVLLLISIIALFSPIIANEKPLYIKYAGKIYFPAFSTQNKYVFTLASGLKDSIILNDNNWKNLTYEQVIWAPIPYSPNSQDNYNMNFARPAGTQLMMKDDKLIPITPRFRHLLGTSARGQDVLSGLLHGSRISLTIGLLSMAIATFIGLLLGAIAGYFGDFTLKISRASFWLCVLGCFVGWFYGFQVRSIQLIDALAISSLVFGAQFFISACIFCVIMILFYQLGKCAKKIKWLHQQVTIPADAIISRVIEIINSLPIFIVIIAIAAIAKPSLTNVMIIIGLTSWPSIARFTRAEILKLKNQDFIQAAKAAGFSQPRILFRHVLPNALAPAFITIAFGIASAILTESSLSFLGVGVPTDIVTWGKLVNQGRQNFEAWWLVVFPGLAIFITVAAYNLIGEALRDALDPKLKQD